MTLIAAAELAAFAGVEAGHPRLEAALASAEALVAAHLGAAELTLRQRLLTLHPPRARRVLELPEGPLAELLAVEEAEVSLDPAGIATGPWLVARAEPFRAGVPLRLSCRLGWDSATAPPPAAVAQALLLAAGDQLARGADPSAAAVRLGDYAVTRAPGRDGLPSEAMALLRPWRRP